MAKELVKPTQAQVRWQNAEFGMFVHFGINTFNNREWTDGTRSPKTFNPKRLDTDQWVQVAKNAGVQYMILTCKHHDGFCLWQTETTDYSVKSSPYKQGKGDVVAEFVSSCRKFGMNFGFYLSPWDRHEPCYKDKEAYDKFYARQLTELLTKYATHDEIFEIWFDGAGSAGREYDWNTIIAICKQHHPSAMIFNMGEPTIRWCGNERGFAQYPNWNVVPKKNIDDFILGKQNLIGEGDIWLPQECDVPIHNRNWFHHKGLWGLLYRKLLFSVDQLVEIYEKSIGYGANLLLNLAPTDQGRFSDIDIRRLNEFTAKIRSMYGTPIATSSGTGTELILKLPGQRKIDAVKLREEISQGQRIKGYELYYYSQNTWIPLKTISKTLTVGHRKIDRLSEQVITDAVKVVVNDMLAEPIILKFCVYSFK